MDLLFWTYLINAVVLINHEIDSAYWQEWKLMNFGEKHGIQTFLLLHFPLLFVVLLGAVLVHDHLVSGMIVSLLLAAGGVFAFAFHTYHLRKGRPEFKAPISKAILVTTLVVSLFQMSLTIEHLVR